MEDLEISKALKHDAEDPRFTFLLTGIPVSVMAFNELVALRWGGRSRSLCRAARAPRSGGNHVPLREGPEVRWVSGSKSPCVVWIEETLRWVAGATASGGRKRCSRRQGRCTGR